jgi:hypothetical protein
MEFPIITKTTEQLEKDIQNWKPSDTNRKGIMLDPLKLFYRRTEKGLRKPSRITFETLRRMSKSCSVARLSINTLKHEVGKTKWSIVPVDPKQVPDDKKVKEVERFFNFPNEDDNFRTFLLKIIEDILSLDAGAIEIVKNSKGGIAEMYYIDGATIKPAIDIHGVLGDPAYFQFMPLNSTGKPDAEFSRDEIVYITMNPQGDIKNYGYGLSPLEGVIMVATNILNADNYNGSFFEVGTLPPILVTLGVNMAQSEVEAFRAYWKAEIEGKPWKTAFLGGVEKPEVLKLQDQTNKDMQFMQYQLWLARMMTAAYEISPQDIGITFDINKAVAEVQREISKAKGYRTLLEIIKEAFTQQIVWKQFGYTDLMFDWRDVDLVDAEVRARIFDIEGKMGAVSINEYRKDIGKDPIKGGTQPFILTAGGPSYIDSTPLEDMSQEDADAEAGTEKQVETHEGGEYGTGGQRTETSTTKKKIEKTVQTGRYLCWMDDRGYGQPFAWTDLLGDVGYYIKPPVSVNLNGPDEEAQITQEMANLGLNVIVAKKVPKKEILNSYLPSGLVQKEFDKYVQMSPDYYSKKWDVKWGKTRDFPYYIVSEYKRGHNLTDEKMVEDMKRDPPSYRRAIYDLANLWLEEKDRQLGDRRANQYLITPDKRAWGFDYQFEGGASHTWDHYKDEIPSVLDGIPELKSLFLDLISGKIKKKIKKSRLNKSIIAKANDKLHDFYHSQIAELEQDLSSHLNNKMKAIYSDVIIPRMKNVANGKQITKQWMDEVDDEWSNADEDWQIDETKKRSNLYGNVFKAGIGLGTFLIANSLMSPESKEGLDKYMNTKMTGISDDWSKMFIDRSSASVKSSAMSLHDSVRNYLDKAREEGLDYKTMAKDIKDIMGWEDQWRAQRIARTESVWAANQGVMKAAEQVGIEEFSVLYGPAPCPDCMDVFGDGDGPFTGDEIGEIPLHPNCECTANPIIPDDWNLDDYIS